MPTTGLLATLECHWSRIPTELQQTWPNYTKSEQAFGKLLGLQQWQLKALWKEPCWPIIWTNTTIFSSIGNREAPWGTPFFLCPRIAHHWTDGPSRMSLVQNTNRTPADISKPCQDWASIWKAVGFVALEAGSIMEGTISTQHFDQSYYLFINRNQGGPLKNPFLLVS